MPSLSALVLPLLGFDQRPSPILTLADGGQQFSPGVSVTSEAELPRPELDHFHA